MRSKEDLIPIVEAAYSLEGTTQSWLQGIADAARPVFDEGWGVLAYAYDATDNAWIKLDGLAGARYSEVALRLGFNPPPAPTDELQVLVKAYRSRPVVTSLGVYRNLPSIFAWYVDMIAKVGCKDMLGINSVDPSARGVCLTAPLKAVPTMAPKTILHRSRVAAHIAAGYRVRQQTASLCAASLEGSPGTEAVFEPGGKLQHAVGPATERAMRHRLRDAVVAIERARTMRLRRSDPERALAIWRGLIEGRWTLLEQFDRDGRRYLILHRNDPTVPDPRALTPRESQVLAYALIGHANKLIGYELGLDESTVGQCLRRVCNKLGVASRVELLQRYSHLVPTPAVTPLQAQP